MMRNSSVRLSELRDSLKIARIGCQNVCQCLRGTGVASLNLEADGTTFRPR